jgi:rhodanese-related sulfurtransferase
MMMKYVRFLIVMLVAQFCFLQSRCQIGYQDLSVQEFKSKLEATPTAVLLDLRTPDEVKEGVIPQATQLDYFRKDFESEVAKLDHHKTYFLYCASAGRSTETAELMAKLGFTSIYNLQGGFTAWKKEKMPVGRLKN